MRNDRVLQVLLLCATAVTPAMAQLEISLPPQPLNPSNEDCNRLSREYVRLRSTIYQEWSACARSLPRLTYATDCAGKRTLVAWPDCQPLAIQLCKIDDAATSEVAACRAHARDDPSEKDTELGKRMERANDLIEKGQSVLTFLNNPQSFLEQTLNPGSILAHSLFREEDKGGFDTQLGEQVYRFAHDYSALGLRSTSNPILSAFQQEMLNQVGRVMQDTLDHADDVSEQLQQITSSIPIPSKVSTTLQPNHQQHTGDCSVFEHEDTSRDLMQKDPNGWLRLYQLCTAKR